MKITERVMQGVLMKYLMNEKQHKFVLPNAHWGGFVCESDLISVTNAGFRHEFEIKLSLSDYKRDANKYKFNPRMIKWMPNYFWYAIHGFDLVEEDLTDKRFGIIEVYREDRDYKVNIIKQALRMNDSKITNSDGVNIARLLSYRIANIYYDHYVRDGREDGHMEMK